MSLNLPLLFLLEEEAVKLHAVRVFMYVLCVCACVCVCVGGWLCLVAVACMDCYLIYSTMNSCSSRTCHDKPTNIRA